MAQPAALVVPPAGPHGDEAAQARQAAALLLAQGLSEFCLAERVEQALRATGYPPLRAVAVSVCGPLVILQGRVPSYYMKQLAQTAALAVAGVRELRNEVDVVRSS
jgi:osmotically-inducible protein OsmY